MRGIFTSLVILLLFDLCQSDAIGQLFKAINRKTISLNAQAADIAWAYSVNPDQPGLARKAASYQKKQTEWQQRTCEKLLDLMNGTSFVKSEKRQTFLLCRGPRFTYEENRSASALLREIQSIYLGAHVCVPTKTIPVDTPKEMEDTILHYINFLKTLKLKTDRDVVALKLAANADDHENETVCLIGEDDMSIMMKLSRNEVVLRWIWLMWREKVGPLMKSPYKELVEVQNRAARRNRYPDIGSSWREDYEIINLRKLCRQLYEDVKPLYTLLHGVVRFFLRKQYGEVVPERGPIPAHLLGDLWAQNWDPLMDLIVEQTIDLDESIQNLNWTVMHMVKRAEDFYMSLGLPAMTDTFWRQSAFTEKFNSTTCHGTAADMFQDGDFRILYCSGTSFEDFYVLHHEMGHIQYFMAYAHQPGLFRQANSALHETIGDTIMLGVMTPQHLHRLGLINDSVLFTSSETPKLKLEEDETEEQVIDDKIFSVFHLPNSEDHDEKSNRHTRGDNRKTEEFNNGLVQIPTDYMLLLKLALNKLPQIPFALLIDEYRWQYFEGGISDASVNEVFWEMALELQGIVPPEKRGEEYFDVGAKFHVPDNTPYIRYFLSSFLQHQLFESLCKAAVFGRRGVKDLPESLTLNRCDIYGSKIAGKILKDFMSRGHSQSWQHILRATVGEGRISSSALLRYYEPLQEFLAQLVDDFDIPLGW